MQGSPYFPFLTVSYHQQPALLFHWIVAISMTTVAKWQKSVWYLPGIHICALSGGMLYYLPIYMHIIWKICKHLQNWSISTILQNWKSVMLSHRLLPYPWQQLSFEKAIFDIQPVCYCMFFQVVFLTFYQFWWIF